MRTQVNFQLTVQPNTSRHTPASVVVNAPVPRITGGELIIPPGSANLVGVRIESRGTPLFDWIIAERQYRWGGGFVMAGPPFPLTVFGFNEDDTYPHTIAGVVFVSMERER